MIDYQEGNSGGLKQELWICTRQRAGPLVKECRALRPRLCANDSSFDRAEKNRILKPPRDSSVCRSRVDRLELRLALFGHLASFYTLTFNDEHLPASFREVERLQDSFFRHGSTIFSLMREGIDVGEQCRECIEAYGRPCCIDDDGECGVLDDVRTMFSDLWNDCYANPKPVMVNGVIDHYESYPWDDIQETRTYRGKPWYVIGNPWVWVIEFERCEKLKEVE